MSYLSIATAVALLGLLLLLSTTPDQEAYRLVDIKLRYLQDSAKAIDQTLDTSLRSQIDASPELAELITNANGVLETTKADLAQVIEPEGLLAPFRRPAMAVFNVVDSSTATLSSEANLRSSAESITASQSALEVAMKEFSQSQKSVIALGNTVSNQGRNFVRSLRERGKEIPANEVYRVQQQVSDRVTSGLDSDLKQIASIAQRLSLPQLGLTNGDRAQAVELGTLINSLANTRMAMNDSIEGMNIAGYQREVAKLKEQATSDYVYTLSTVNDARVLLNVYTVLLLAVLAYFGYSLHKSYRALNESHDDLELRVQERTADLEQALEDLTESQVQLVQAEKMSSLGQLVAGVMHEINTPLLYVLNNASVTSEIVTDLQQYVEATLPVVQAHNADDAQLAMKNLLEHREDLEPDQIGENTEEIVTLCSDSIEGLNQISELVQSLKDFSRLDRAAQDRFDVREGIEKTLLITKHILKYGVEVEKDFAPIPDIYCSPSRLNQIFINIITNAAQAMDGKGKLSIRTQQVKDWVEIIFEDTGCGIPQEHLNKIMDPFFTTKPVGQGTGLGLSIVSKIVEEHHGQLLVDSKEGLGTRITLGFPINKPTTEESSTDSAVEAA